MNPCALPTRDVSGLSCLSCPFARCWPSFVCPLGSVLSSEVQVPGLEPGDELPPGEQSLVQPGVLVVPGLQLEVHAVLPPLLLDACNAGPCRRNGTRKAPIPATIRAIAPTLRFADVSILVFPFSLFLELNPRFERAGYMIQRFEQPERCQTEEAGLIDLCVFGSV